MHLPVDINGFHITNLDKVRTKTKSTSVHSVYNSLREGENCSEQQRLLLCFSENNNSTCSLYGWKISYWVNAVKSSWARSVEVEPVCTISETVSIPIVWGWCHSCGYCLHINRASCTTRLHDINSNNWNVADSENRTLKGQVQQKWDSSEYHIHNATENSIM
jgi:hypothetical protein